MDFVDTLRAAAYAGRDGPDRPEDLQGWVNAGFDDALDLVRKRCGGCDVFLEIGTWKGASAVRIASTLKPKALVCIDTWLGAPEFYTWGYEDGQRNLLKERGYPTVFHTFVSNVLHRKVQDVVVPFPMSSAQAAEILRNRGVTAAGAYVDGSHEYDAVLADLRAYRPLVTTVLWGDDWGWSGVQKAVLDFAAEHNVTPEVHADNWLLWLT